MKIKRVSSILLVIALGTVCSIGTSFAGTLPENAENTVPVYLTVNGGVTIDFTISESITMVGNPASADVTVSDLSITNNGSMGQIEVKKLEADTTDGWTIEDSESDFVNMKADSKKISLKYGQHDFVDGAKTFTEDEILIDASQTEALSFTGKTSPTTAALSNVQVASIVATVAIN